LRIDSSCPGQQLLPLRRTFLEFQLGLIGLDRTRRALLCGDLATLLRSLWSGHFDGLAAATEDAVLLLDLQVREAAHRLGCHRTFLCLLEIATVALCGKFEAVIEMDLVDIGGHSLELGESTVPGRGSTARGEAHGQKSKDVKPPNHGSSTLACACVARS
jgi:hypothetical protein